MLILTRLCLAYSSTASTRAWQSRSEQVRLAGDFPKQNLQLVIRKQIKVFNEHCSYQELTQGLPTGEAEDREKDDFSSVSLPSCSRHCTCLKEADLVWLYFSLWLRLSLCLQIVFFFFRQQKLLPTFFLDDFCWVLSISNSKVRMDTQTCSLDSPF